MQHLGSKAFGLVRFFEKGAVLVTFCLLDTNQSHLGKEDLDEELSPSHWPVCLPAGHVLD